MIEQDILRLRDLAEAGQVQFKERIVSKDDKYQIGCEMVALWVAKEFVITIPRKNEQVTDQGNLDTDPAQVKTDPVQQKTDPVNDQAPSKTDPGYSKNEQPTRTYQNTVQITHNTDPASSKSEQPHIKLSKKQKDIRNFCSVPRTAKEIMNRLELSDFYNNRKRYIYDLVEAGVLERTIPDRPNDPNQKYRRKQ